MRSCLICDDHAILREAMAQTIRKGWPNVIVTEADDYPSAWSEATANFDLCISDLFMPGSDPVEGITQLRNLQPQMPIVILTGSTEDRLMMELLALGVRGFVPKSSSGPVLKAAIDLVIAGGKYLPPGLLALAQGQVTETEIPPTIQLTKQQKLVLLELKAGQTDKEIAIVLGVAPSTVKFHVDELLKRLDARNRSEALYKAHILGLI